MPTISINQKDFEQLVGRPTIAAEPLDAWLPLVKAELKDQDSESGEVRLELHDSNRPDLWSCEGIARQIRIKLQGAASAYPFFKPTPRPKRRIQVMQGLERVRPYIAACTAVGYKMTGEGLAQLVQTQEKLADIFGRKRRTISIGLYRLPQIVFPVTYTLVKPEEVRFTPLGVEEKMSPREILAVHPKGLEYGPILAGHDRLPLLMDEEGQVLSLPPIINSREIGEVRVGDRELFVEVTGTDLPMVLLTLNILAVNLADRGATIEAVEVAYPYATELGKTVRTPFNFQKARSIPIKTIEDALGVPLGAERIRQALLAYGYEASASKDRGAISVKIPPYRNDLMHPLDVVEDVAISRGYGEFTPIMPSQFTVGSLSRLEEMSDRVRDMMVGMGFQEIISNIMASRQELIDRMHLAGSDRDQIVEVENVMTQAYSCLRQWITPSLLRVEAASTRAFYPHRLFEVGEVAVPDATEETGVRTLMVLGALIAHANANFSEAHSCLDLLLFYLDRPYTLEPISHRSFLDGRAGRIVSNGRAVGLIGEIHPEVLEHWQVSMPSVVFELEVDALVNEGKS
ncbi:MAG: phenylalanine--tRNA ligase subunit beta [Nitrospirae bacterium]|nr:MAG: phenylalanine--tRNA ligase subunit beta [Nitrospirae bacterium 13_2_20CM_2_62_8]TLY44429.1 MAG: phenylalanine--tRNA ligase subunit beta [Nitrospirota bacterium]TLY44472.1 MAG: phenylalanine--tRNA ligase subunit beta [Nitrospirota bacterium]